jgi:hypothetical protein
MNLCTLPVEMDNRIIISVIQSMTDLFGVIKGPNLYVWYAQIVGQ